ncbi:MAG: ABC transporter ATP-binding protein [Rhodothalassiaceae bacterium]
MGLEARALVKRFGAITAVDGISFTLNRGDVLGFLGPNGAGKSTTMKMLTGFLRPTAGTALICGQDVQDAPEAAKARLGYLPEGAPAYADMTPRQLLRFVADARGLDQVAPAIDRAVEALSLARVLDRPIETLSKGFRRRVGLAQAILHDPEVLILDEPTDGLDPNQKHEVRRLIQSMAADKAIIVSTHILEEVEAVCSRAIVIDRGRVVYDGSPQGFRALDKASTPIELRVTQADAPAARTALEGIGEGATVRETQTPDGFTHLYVDGPDKLRLTARIADLAAANAWTDASLTVAPASLDRVFRQLTSSDAPVKEAAE